MNPSRRTPPARSLIVTALLTLVIACCACGDTNDHPKDGQKVRLRIGNFRLKTEGGYIGNLINAEIVRRFQDRNPDIEITPATGIVVPGKSQQIAPLMQIAGNIPPDLLFVDMVKTESYISQGLLEPLDDCIDAAFMKDLKERLHPRVWDVIRRRGPDGKEHIYCLPVEHVLTGLLYRRDWLRDSGLPDRAPATWEEFMQWNHKLVDPKRGRFGLLATTDLQSLGRAYRIWLWSMRGDYLKSVGPPEDDNWEAAFNSPEAVDAAYLMLRIFKEKYTANGQDVRGHVFRYDEQRETPLAGSYCQIQAVMGWAIAGINPEVQALAAIPRSEKGLGGAEINCHMYGIFAGLPEWRKRTAWTFLRYYASREVEETKVDVMVREGYGQFVQPILLERYGYTDILGMLPPQWIKDYGVMWKNAIPSPYQKNCALVYMEAGRPLSQMLADPELERLLDAGDEEEEIKARIQKMLDRGVEVTNEKMLGKIPAVKMLKRRRVATAFLIVSGLAMLLAFVHVVKVLTPPPDPGRRRAGWQFWKYRRAYLLLLPAVGLVALWQYYPLVKGMVMAFQDYRIMGDHRWIGLDNFAMVLFDPQFWNAMLVTVKYVALMIGIGFFLPLILAIMLTEVPRGTVLLRTLFYLPAVISGLIVVFLWRYFFQPYGLLNQILGLVGIEVAKDWVTDPHLAILCCVIPSVWASMGPGCLIYLAALKTVSPDLYEAAQIDGAGFFQRCRHIVFPSLKGLIIINFVGAVVGAFRSIGLVFAMTGGGPYTPYGQTEVIGLQIFYNAFMFLKFGIATAMAWILGSMLIGFTMIQLKRLSRMEFKTADQAAAQ